MAPNQAQNWDLVTSTTALNFESGLFNIDTTNSRIGIGTTAPGHKLDVSGDINVSSVYRIGGTTVLSHSSSGENCIMGLDAGSTAPHQSYTINIGHGSINLNSTNADQNTCRSMGGQSVTSGK
ncbi:hypothetical protein IPM65_03415 [Candidatus Roizmanbacteria bacterium]|nr:MAG: hypothetical protein IPM65_03415 [Candidatus Roizmanbacteria bacterium]